MRNRILLFLVACSAMLPILVSSIATDLGDCACLCGIESTGGVVGSNGVEGTSLNSFANRVRGEKGDRGLTGKQGIPGKQGRPGMRGARGPPGISGGGGNNDAVQSCWDLRSSGHTQSGIYKIKPSSDSSTMQVYCDMDVNGGGWTLVGSVHENNIQGKCSLGDNWSDNQGRNGQSASNSWMNTATFGNVESATSGDYKNSAYFSLPASDVMVWHVPNNNPPSQWANRATLKYYTSNGFLNEYGGNLRNLYNKHFPMEAVTSEVGAYEGVQTIVSYINESSADIRNVYPRFFEYMYDGDGRTAIGDGGNDMYDTGNRVYFSAGNAEWTRMTYGEKYNDLNSGFEVASAAGHPFITLMYIQNPGGRVPRFNIKVESGTGADGSGSATTYDGEINFGEFNMKYKSYNVYGANDPSITEVYFVVYSSTWNSVVNTHSSDFFTATQWSRGTDNLVNAVQVGASPQNVLFGYSLFSRSDDQAPQRSELRDAMLVMLRQISQFPSIAGFNCSRLAESAVAPVTFHTGSAADILASTPPQQRDDTTPGYLQLRALNPKGVPFAMCPGVKTEACRPSSVCVGGINTMMSRPELCGDFTGYGGLTGDAPTETEPVGSARSLNDLNSSILIFTRDSDEASSSN